MRQQIEAAAKTTAGIYKINQGDIRSFGLALPTLAEQREIASRVNSRFYALAELERTCTTELRRSSALRQSILKDAFSGRLVPQDPDDEPAETLLARIRSTRSPKPRKANA